jgi:hypothetical protein
LLGLLVFLIPVGPSIGNLNALVFNDYEYDVDYYEQDYGIEDKTMERNHMKKKTELSQQQITNVVISIYIFPD